MTKHPRHKIHVSGFVRAPSRRAVIGGLVGLTYTVSPFAAKARSEGPPPFGTERHQFTLVSGARPIPAIPIPKLGGGSTNLAAFRGKVVLVNLWATWCAACRIELPMLDQLAASNRRGLEIVSVAVDREGRAVVAPFVKSLKLRRLMIGLDPGGFVARAGDDGVDSPFALYAMPITYLIGVTGEVEGYIAGETDWLSAEAERLIGYYTAAAS